VRRHVRQLRAAPRRHGQEPGPDCPADGRPLGQDRLAIDERAPLAGVGKLNLSAGPSGPARPRHGPLQPRRRPGPWRCPACARSSGEQSFQAHNGGAEGLVTGPIADALGAEFAGFSHVNLAFLLRLSVPEAASSRAGGAGRAGLRARHHQTVPTTAWPSTRASTWRIDPRQHHNGAGERRHLRHGGIDTRQAHRPGGRPRQAGDR